MDLNTFSAFFQFFAGLNFLYAGSESFRYAVNDTFLRLGDSLNAIKESLKNQTSYLEVAMAEPGSIADRAYKLAENQQNADKLMKKEENLRKFPDGCKSMFLATGLFCLIVMLLGGFEQFLVCSESINISLAVLNIIGFYNVFIFGRSFIEKKCEKNLNSLIPIALIMALLVVAYLISNYLPYMIQHAQSHADNKDLIRFQPHSNYIAEKANISAALLVCTSPFLLHMVRVYLHKKYFKSPFKKMDSSLKDETEKIQSAQILITKTQNTGGTSVRTEEISITATSENHLVIDQDHFDHIPPRESD